MNEKENIYEILINKDNKIPDDILMLINLISIKDVNGNDVYIEEKTKENYEKLKKYLFDKENVKIGICSSYRTAEKQMAIKEQFTNLYGKEYADSIVAPVNYSEHQTGLAIDLEICCEDEGFISNNKNVDKTRIVFEKKIHKHLHKFGFILRYPKEKEAITKYPYEPWHIRFVGERIASKIYNAGITLEEFYEKSDKIGTK